MSEEKMSEEKNVKQIYTVTVRQPAGDQQFHGTYSAEITAEKEVKAAFILTNELGTAQPVTIHDRNGGVIRIMCFDAVAINQHNEARLFNTFNGEVDKANTGTFVRVQPPIIGLG